MIYNNGRNDSHENDKLKKNYQLQYFMSSRYRSDK